MPTVNSAHIDLINAIIIKIKSNSSAESAFSLVPTSELSILRHCTHFLNHEQQRTQIHADNAD